MKTRFVSNTLFKSIISMAMVLMLATSIFSQNRGIKLEEGTPVRLRLMQDINSATAQAGQTLSFEVIDDVKVGSTIVIAEGSQAIGTIVEAEAKKSLGRAGKLAFQ